MCAEPLFVIPVCETKIRAKNSSISRLWLVEIGDRVGPVDGSICETLDVRLEIRKRQPWCFEM